MKRIHNAFILIGSVLLIGVICSCVILPRSAKNSLNNVRLDELDSVLNSMTSGGVVYLESGVYDNLMLKISTHAIREITVKPKVPGTVKITGKSSVNISNSSNLKLEGLLFENIVREPIVIDNSQNIGVGNNYFLSCGSSPTSSIIRVRNNSFNNIIYHNTFEDSRAIVINIHNRPGDVNNTGNQIYGNLFYNTRAVKSIYPESDGNGLETIQLGQNHNADVLKIVLDTKVFGNLFEDIEGDGVEIISNKSSGNQIFNNTFLNNRSGITLRAGDDVRVEGNYLFNTLRGIRVYGSGHYIRKNYIYGAEVAISLPTSDFVKGEEFTGSGYHQQENLEIVDNVIVSPRLNAVSIGEGERKLLPKNIQLINNRSIITDSVAGDFDVSSRMSNENIRFSDNQVVLETDSVGNTRRGSTTRFDNSQIRYTVRSKVNSRVVTDKNEINEIIGFEPFRSLDERVGADWKRPMGK